MDRIIRMQELCRIIGCSKGSIYNWIKSQEFPPPVRLGGACVGWRESDLSEWMQARQPKK